MIVSSTQEFPPRGTPPPQNLSICEIPNLPVTHFHQTDLATNRNAPVICDTCGSQVERKSRQQKFCSTQCRQKGGKRRLARVVPANRLEALFRDEPPKIIKEKQRAKPVENGEIRENRKPSNLRWEQINKVTYKLHDPTGAKVETPRSHGQWPGFRLPEAAAWVFDTGNGWRVRVRRGNGWRHLGVMLDLQTAKKAAISAVNGDPSPSIFSPTDMPLSGREAMRFLREARS